MKKGFCAFVALLSSFIALTANAATTTPGPFEACDQVRSVTSGGMIYKNSAPLRSGGIGTPIVGYRIEPTLILVGAGIGDKRTTNIYAANGTKIGRCPWASAEGTRGGRYRCTMNTRRLRQAAVKAAASPTIYFKLKTGQCAQVNDAGRCYGSSKGLCNQTLK
jgi:hypothetical protein